MESWKDVVGYEGYYQVSDLGNIKSLRSGINLKPQKGRGKYKRVGLNVKGHKQSHSIHQLVCIAFLGESDLQVDHIDEDPSNNKLSNLRWLGNADNTARSQGKSFRVTNGTKTVLGFNRNEFCRVNGINHGHFGQVMLGQRKSASGWRLA